MDSEALLTLTGQLLEGVERLRPLPGLLVTEDGGDLRQTVLLYLRTKIVPELTVDMDLPLFVAVQGGANTGKSTVFNALSGKILSPSIVQASATKHPLVYLHERWRQRFLEESPFTGFDCQPLTDPKELIVEPGRTELLYVRFHEDRELETVALIDSPDFDGALLTNLEVARSITALSDVTLFVTTSQKYRDRELVRRLRLLGELKACILLVFNMVDEEIVFQTLVDDLEEVMPVRKAGIEPIRLPRSGGQHPEDDLREILRARVLEQLTSFDSREVKPDIIGRAMRRVLATVGSLEQRFEPELEFKDRLLELTTETAHDQVRQYSASFSLSFPEETMAVRRILDMTDIGPRLQLPREAQGGSNILLLVGLSLRRLNEVMRDLLVRLSRSTEGVVEDTPGALADYALARNETDFERVLRGAETLRVTVETHCRSQQEAHAIAREVLAVAFSPERVREFAERVRAEFERVMAEREERPEEILSELDSWKRRHPGRQKALFVAVNTLKILGGVGLAVLIPPSGFFSVLNWLYFTVGFFLVSYLVALLTSVLVRRRQRFRESRIRAMRQVLDRALVEPLAQSLDAVLDREELQAVVSARKRLEAALPRGGGEAGPERDATAQARA